MTLKLKRLNTIKGRNCIQEDSKPSYEYHLDLHLASQEILIRRGSGDKVKQVMKFNYLSLKQQGL